MTTQTLVLNMDTIFLIAQYNALDNSINEDLDNKAITETKILYVQHYV